VPIRYVVTGFEVGPGGGYLNVYLGPPQSSVPFAVCLDDPSGVAYLEGHPMLSGRRTLTFQLATADHRPVTDPQAQVTVPNVIIEGERASESALSGGTECGPD